MIFIQYYNTKQAYRFLHPGHWTITTPFSYALFVNVCEERVEQFGAVHVKVIDKRGSSGSVCRRCVCDVDDWDNEDKGAESDGPGAEESLAFALLDKTLESEAGVCACGPPVLVLLAL